jgi:adenylate cyclase
MKTSKYNEYSSQFIKIFWITVGWTIFSVFQFLIGLSILLELNCDIAEDAPMFYFMGSLLTGLLAGVIGGSILVLLWEKWLRSKNYGIALLYIFWSFVIVFIIVAFCTGLYFESHKLGVPFYAYEVWYHVFSTAFTLDQLQSFFVWLAVVLITLIILQVNDKYGPGVFRSFLLGQYFQPKREERIFMFLDLRSSTTIAEKLGEVRYFNFIKEVFRDVTPAILNSKGDIYQYVGDEIVISWKMENGIRNANCIQCFFEIQQALRRQSAYYKSTYDNIAPEFKAGLHYGHVMAGEVGVVKRDIVYSGDVLNTAARIQSKCNELGVNILFSKYLLDKLRLKPNLFDPQKMGDIGLRGKQEKVILYTV